MGNAEASVHSTPLVKMLCLLATSCLIVIHKVSGDGAAGYGRGPAGGGGGGPLGGGGGGGGGGFGGGGGGFGASFNGPPQPYTFQYAVRDAYSGADFSQSESGNGAGNVDGQYQVLLPDGRNQVVKYTASDATGYIADVQYSGQAYYGGGGGGGGGYGGSTGGSGGGGFGGGAGGSGGGGFDGGAGGSGGGGFGGGAGGAGGGSYLPPVGK
ncbi:probable H/ACA ribonucleoprotein complex subunit 1 [Anabrus simplex]|uniref:probable H/ACA ribonucleoprotein complex subunit 1 n=1 Tax=Anabrus simplex TaxID=316456 RepID=UPI0035A2CAD7